MRKNLRFNRYERGKNHSYVMNFDPLRHRGNTDYSGYCKCKLVHHRNYSLIVPDLIMLDLGGVLYWIQPLFFVASLIQVREGKGICRLGVNISFGAIIQVKFDKHSLVRQLDDGSSFYTCVIKGPKYLYRYATGRGKIIDSLPFIKLYHHTTKQAKENIIESSEFWSSKWNIQGTKELSNISYVYLTALDEIKCDSDLQEIAMSSEGVVRLRLDQNVTDFPDDKIVVYRESTKKRTHSIGRWVRADYLAPQPIYRHEPPGKPVYYEIFGHFIQRVGVSPNTVVKLKGERLEPCAPRYSKYILIGITNTVKGLRAPYDEEDTEEIWKIEYIEQGKDLFD